MAWSVDHKEKRELLVSLPPRNVHILNVQRNTKEMEVNSLLLKHCFASPRGKKRQKLLCIWSKLSWFKFVFLLLRNDKDYDNECLRKKNIIWDQCHFAFSTESVRFRIEGPWRHMYGSLSATNCGHRFKKDSFLPTSSFDILFNDNKKFHPLCKSKKLPRDLPPSWWEFAYDHFWLEPCSTCSQVYYSVMITYDDHGDNYDDRKQS